jgi:hypothetical protein
MLTEGIQLLKNFFRNDCVDRFFDWVWSYDAGGRERIFMGVNMQNYDSYFLLK